MKKCALKIVVAIVVVVVLTPIAILIVMFAIDETKHRHPTSSRAGELRIVSNDFSTRLESVSLVYQDGSRYVLNLDQTVNPGEPQCYQLPSDLLEETEITVYLAFFDLHNGYHELDVMVFFVADTGRNSLMQNGLLVFFSNGGSRVQVVSGNTQICYIDKGNWVVLEDPPALSHRPDGMGPNPLNWTTGWENNTWVFIPSGDAITIN